MFITTANTLRMPQPLMDRMEIIRIPGYTEDEKVEIAKRHLIPKEDEGARPEGRRVEDHRRRAARPDPLLHPRSGRAQSRTRDRQPDPQGGEGDRLGQGHVDRGDAAKISATMPACGNSATAKWKARTRSAWSPGLAWTEVGGDTLQIESVMLPGKGRMQTTGKLGDVMKESIDAARSYRALQGDDLRHQAADVRQARHPRPRARRRHAQGRPLGRRGDGGLDHLGAHRHPGAPRRGDDRRGDACAAACCRSAG